MKVIVCFHNVRVTVPCGDGEILIKELISKAVHRYKRATGKNPNHWVEVTTLKSTSGGGILDPDDQIIDVVDDREQLVAEFEESDRPTIQHNGGDGASASSTGTTSPDFFQGGDNANRTGIPAIGPGPAFLTGQLNSSGSNSQDVDVVVVTPGDLSIATNLRVRRGSEPNINLLSDHVLFGNIRPSVPRRESVRESDDPKSESSDEDKKLKMASYGSLDRKKVNSRFQRDGFRSSLSARPDMYKWIEAQHRQEEKLRLHQTKERTGPVDGHDGKDLPESNGSLICLKNDGGPLGIHAVPAFDGEGKDLGLLIQSIEPNRPVQLDGRIQPQDVIVEINGTSLYGVPFLKAQDIFRSAMSSTEIRLQVIKSSLLNKASDATSESSKSSAPAVLPKPRSHVPHKPSPLTLAQDSEASLSSPQQSERTFHDLKNGVRFQTSGMNQPFSNSSTSSSTSHKTESQDKQPVIKAGPPIKPPKKVPPAVPVRSPTTSMSSHIHEAPLNALTNTRRIGKMLEIDLRKGPLGLGFSVTSRDNQTDGECPIYIRNILAKGAAVQDGQLRSGDRLLQVNNVEMTGKSQAEVVALLRQLPEGAVVKLLVSRQEEVDEKFKLPRKLGEAGDQKEENEQKLDFTNEENKDKVESSCVQPQPYTQSTEKVDSEPWDSSNRVELHIPINETGSAGLGVSVKGRSQTMETGVQDLGIFVKSILQGGAASKDGRLQVNDQLLEVNGVSLEKQSNTSAMEALRVAMLDNGPIPGSITLTISRKTGTHSSISSPLLFHESSDILPPPIHQRSSSAEVTTNVIHQRSSSASDSFAHRLHSFGEPDLPSPIPPSRTKRVAALREFFSDNGGSLRNQSYMLANHDSIVEPGLRNESYTKATHESFADSNDKAKVLPKEKDVTVSVEDQSNDIYATLKKVQRPHSSIGFHHGTLSKAQSLPSDDEAFQRLSVASGKDEQDLSPMGDVILPFSREGFGRQSMSEKRKGHLDPRNTEIYKLVKAKQETKESAQNNTKVKDTVDKKENLDSSPSMKHVHDNCTYQGDKSKSESTSTTKRSSSLEDMADPSADSAIVSSSSGSQQTRDSSPSWLTNRFGRSRACNDSFRAAVDRSYEAVDPALMDTLEEESAESGAFTLDPSLSGRSSISSEATEDSNSLKRRKEKKTGPGLLKGFLRFGKGRKSNEEAMRRSRSEERSNEKSVERRADQSVERMRDNMWISQRDVDDGSAREIEMTRGRHPASLGTDKDYAPPRNLQFTDHRVRSQSVDPTTARTGRSSSSLGVVSPFQAYTGDSTVSTLQDKYSEKGNYKYIGQKSQSVEQQQSSITKAVMSRAEYIQQLRGLYQQQHKKRQGVYPLDDAEEFYEKQIQRMENKHPYAIPTQSYSSENVRERYYPRELAPTPPPRQRNNSSSMSNMNNSSYEHQPPRQQYIYHHQQQPQHHHHFHQQQQPQQYRNTNSKNNGNIPQDPGSRPQSRTAFPSYSYGNNAYAPRTSGYSYTQTDFYRRLPSDDPSESSVFDEGYSSQFPSTYTSYNSRHPSGHQGIPQSYHSRATPPYLDPGSAKV